MDLPIALHLPHLPLPNHSPLLSLNLPEVFEHRVHRAVFEVTQSFGQEQ